MGQGSEPREQRGGGRREGDAGDARYGAFRREDASSRFPSQTLAHTAGRLSAASRVSAEMNVAAASHPTPFTVPMGSSTSTSFAPPPTPSDTARPIDGEQSWDLWWPPSYVFYRVLRASLRSCAPPSRVLTGLVASALAWASGFPAPGDLEGQ